MRSGVPAHLRLSGLAPTFCLTLSAFCLFLAVIMSPASADETRVVVPGAPVVSDCLIQASVIPQQSDILHISFALKSARKAGILAFIATQHDPKSAKFHKWLTPVQFGQQFGAPQADVDAVVAFAKSQQFKITHIWENHLFISVDATVAQAEKAFGVHIQGYTRTDAQLGPDERRDFYAPAGPVTLPTAVAARVENVSGLDNALQLHPTLTQAQRPDTGPGGIPMPINAPPLPTASGPFTSALSPSDISTFYGLDTFHNNGIYGDGQNIAIFEATSFSIYDINAFANYYGLTGYTVVVENVDGGAGGNTNGQQEACLDAEVIIGQAPHATIWAFECPGSLTNWTDTFNTIASSGYQGSGTPNIQVVSVSWGISEKALHARGEDYIASDWFAAISQLNTEGVAFYVSSGDVAGVPVSPSTDPCATAVGGTDNLVENSDGTWRSEQGWGSSVNGTGGGNSIYFSLPSWQQQGPGVINSYSNGFRQVPDVSADGGPNPGYWIMADYNGSPAWYRVWGTSASCPLWAAANLLLDQQGNNYYNLTQWHSGSLNAELYWIGTNLNAYRDTLNGAFVFRDVTIADPGCPFPCTDGWDYVTGWGSANFWKLWADCVELWGAVGAPYDGRAGNVSLSNSNGNIVTKYDNVTTYSINAPVACEGPADLAASTMDVNVDGVDNFFPLGPLPVNTNWSNGGLLPQVYSVGPHQITQTLNVVTPYYNTTTTMSRLVIVVQPAPAALTLAPESVVGGSSVIGTVTLNAPVFLSDAVVELSSANSAATVPATVTIKAGKARATFTVNTSAVTTDTTGTISATYNGDTLSTNLDVKPIALDALTLSPSSVYGGTSVVGTVTLNGKAPTGGTDVRLSSDNWAAMPPASIKIAEGTTTKNFTITTVPVATIITGAIKAAYGASKASAKLTVKPNGVKSFTLSPARVVGGKNATGTVTLLSPAISDTTVTFTSSNSGAVPAPASITIPTGSLTGTVTIPTNATTKIVSATISAQTDVSLIYATAKLTVIP